MREARTRAGGGSIAFSLVTSLAAFVVAATGIGDLVAGSVNLSSLWTWLVVAAALSIAAAPLMLAERFHPAVALVGCWVFAAVTALQVASGGDTLMTVNNLVLYPMISCYLGWFFRPSVARATVGALFVLSGAALVKADHLNVFSTWANLALASLFCLEAALYLHAKLERQAHSDPLTGALNRNGLAARIGHELSRTARARGSLSVAAVDLDGLKAINDRLGHHAGDQALVTLVDDLQRLLRPHDTIARIGGDEFVVLLPGTTADSAAAIMQRLQADSQAAWTFGLTTARSTDTQDSLLRRADADLYAKKGLSQSPRD